MVKKKKLLKWLTEIITLIVVVAIGGLFTTGTTLTFPILSWIPEIVHTLVGWAIILVSIVQFIMKIVK